MKGTGNAVIQNGICTRASWVPEIQLQAPLPQAPPRRMVAKPVRISELRWRVWVEKNSVCAHPLRTRFSVVHPTGREHGEERPRVPLAWLRKKEHTPAHDGPHVHTGTHSHARARARTHRQARTPLFIHRWQCGGPVRASDLLKVTQQGRGRAGTRTRSLGPQTKREERRQCV